MTHYIYEDKMPFEDADEPVPPESDPDVVRNDVVTEIEEVVKTGLVCAGTCVKEDDEILW